MNDHASRPDDWDWPAHVTFADQDPNGPGHVQCNRFEVLVGRDEDMWNGWVVPAIDLTKGPFMSDPVSTASTNDRSIGDAERATPAAGRRELLGFGGPRLSESATLTSPVSPRCQISALDEGRSRGLTSDGQG